MKKTLVIMGGVVLLFAASVQAQQKTWEAKKNPTVDSITSPYEGKLLSSRPAPTTQDAFPVLGKYEGSSTTNGTDSSSLSTGNNSSVVITLDEQNKGLVWVDGLPQGKIKAMLRKSPAVYKIPAQKTEDGKDVAEGTLVFDKETNMLRIVIGKPFNSDDPLAAFSTTDDNATAQTDALVSNTKTAKNKKAVQPVVQPKPWMYSATKVDKSTSMN